MNVELFSKNFILDEVQIKFYMFGLGVEHRISSKMSQKSHPTTQGSTVHLLWMDKGLNPINPYELRIKAEVLEIQTKQKVICDSLLVDKLNKYIFYDFDEQYYKK